MGPAKLAYAAYVSPSPFCFDSISVRNPISFQTWCIKFAAVAVIFLKAVISLIHIPSYNYTITLINNISLDRSCWMPHLHHLRVGFGWPVSGLRTGHHWNHWRTFSAEPRRTGQRPSRNGLNLWKWRKLSGTSPCIDSFDFFYIGKQWTKLCGSSPLIEVFCRERMEFHGMSRSSLCMSMLIYWRVTSWPLGWLEDIFSDCVTLWWRI